MDSYRLIGFYDPCSSARAKLAHRIQLFPPYEQMQTISVQIACFASARATHFYVQAIKHTFRQSQRTSDLGLRTKPIVGDHN
jgi:hypothetical protein